MSEQNNANESTSEKQLNSENKTTEGNQSKSNNNWFEKHCQKIGICKTIFLIASIVFLFFLTCQIFKEIKRNEITLSDSVGVFVAYGSFVGAIIFSLILLAALLFNWNNNDNGKCYFCQAEINATAKKCTHCGAWLNWIQILPALPLYILFGNILTLVLIMFSPNPIKNQNENNQNTKPKTVEQKIEDLEKRVDILEQKEESIDTKHIHLKLSFE